MGALEGVSKETLEEVVELMGTSKEESKGELMVAPKEESKGEPMVVSKEDLELMVVREEVSKVEDLEAMSMEMLEGVLEVALMGVQAEDLEAMVVLEVELEEDLEQVVGLVS